MLQQSFSAQFLLIFKSNTIRALTFSRLAATSRTIFPRHQFFFRHIMNTAMGKRLQGKTILITGASSGIGRSTAKEFARTSPQSLKLIITARRIDKLEELATEIREESGGQSQSREGVKVLPVQLDVSKSEEVRGLIASLPEEFREVDVLVNNA